MFHVEHLKGRGDKMKIKVLIPKNNLCDIGLLLKELKKEKCEYYTGEEHGEFTSF